MKAQYMKCKLTKIDKKNTVILRLLLLLWIFAAAEPVFSEKHYVFRRTYDDNNRRTNKHIRRNQLYISSL